MIENQVILTDIKKLLGITKEDESFDTDIIININSAFVNLNQLGIGPKEGFRIYGYEEEWEDFIPEDTMLDSIKTYIYLKVKLVFDPPLNSTLLESFERQIRELEWRLSISVETNPLEEE